MRHALYTTLRLVSRYGYLLRRRFTNAGLLALTSLVATAVVGVDTNQTLAYQLFAFLFFLVLFAILQSWFFNPKLTIKRTLPPLVTVGESFEYRIELRNEATAKEIDLALLENLIDPRPSFETFCKGLNRPRLAKTFLRRFSIWDKWQGMIASARPAVIEAQLLPELAANRSVEIRPRVKPQRRGSIDFTGITIARADRFGLFRGFKTYAKVDSLLVLPRRYALPELTLPGARVYQHGGMTLASSVGDSEEFLGLRDYRPGDPLKSIHWKSFARTGTPVVKEFQDEFFDRHALILDTFGEGVSDEVFEEGVSIAASFAADIDTHECLLDLLFMGAETYCFTAGRGQLHTGNLLEILAHTKRCEDKPFSELTESVMERRPLLSGCILVLLSWDAERRALVSELEAAALPIVSLVVGAAPRSDDARPGVHFLQPGEIAQGLATL